MSKATEIKERACALRTEKRELEARLGQARGREETAIERDLARVKEDLVDCARQLRELLPGHRIGRGGATWSGVEGWRWDRIQHQTWTELEGADLPEGPTDRDKMRLAVRAARRGVTQAQEKYLAEADQGKKAAQIARETGRHRSTVCRTLRRGEKRIAEDARALYQLLGRQEGGPMVVDLSRPDVLKAVLDRLTIRQQTYLYLYYGEWLSLREIGSLLGVDHASVLRSIRCGLKRVENLSLGGQIEVRELDGVPVNFTGNSNTLIIHNRDSKGYIADVTTTLSRAGINIANMNLCRDRRGGSAIMVIEIDEKVPPVVLQFLKEYTGISRIIYYEKEDE